MHIDKFMPILLRNAGIVRYLETILPTISWSVYQRYAALTEFVDYKCDFDKSTGVCKTCKNFEKFGRKSNDKACCCKGCASNVGYFKYIPANWGVLKLLAKNYSKTKGFWREGVGCILPRKYRSMLCLGHQCYMKVFNSPVTPDKLLIQFFKDPTMFKYHYRNGLTQKSNPKLTLPNPEQLEELLKAQRK